VEHKFTPKNPRNFFLDLQKKLNTEEQNITIAEQKLNLTTEENFKIWVTNMMPMGISQRKGANQI
jgi:hypothetical protein